MVAWGNTCKTTRTVSPHREPWKQQQWHSIIQQQGEDTRSRISPFRIPAIDDLCKLASAWSHTQPPLLLVTLHHHTCCSPNTEHMHPHIDSTANNFSFFKTAPISPFPGRLAWLRSSPSLLGVTASVLFQHPGSTSTKALLQDTIWALFSFLFLCTS